MTEMKPVFLPTEHSEVYGLCWIQECPCYWYALEYNKAKQCDSIRVGVELI